MPMAMDSDTAVEQQMLVQWCMAAQLFTESEFRDAVQRTQQSTDAEEEIHPLIEQLNHTLGAFSLELRSCMDQTSGVRMWALANTNADAISMGATPYTASELVTLKTLVEGVFTEPAGNYALSLHDALRLVTRRVGAPTRAEAETLLARFCGDGWLAMDQGFVALGARAVIELQSFFSVGFPDYIRLCSLCKEMATKGIVCTECLEPVHPYCADRVAGGKVLACPACNRHIAQPRKFGPGERGVPHALDDVASAREPSEEPATQSIKKLRIEDSSDEE
ncbi:hypothetical protein GGI24_004188 [Coemansia furcata]|nr:hypothetical protein GGI24_004188 [Coemansia furcata]